MLIQGDGIPEAIELSKEAVALTRVQGEHTNNHGLALNMLSKAYMLHNDLDEALDYRRRAIAVFTSIFPATHSAVLEARVDLGVALMRASQFEAAHRELAEAVGLVRETGAMPRAYPWMLSRLASATAEIGHADEAIRLFEQAVELLASTVGNDHPQTVNQRFNLAALLVEEGRLDDAERVVRVIEHSGKRGALLHGWLAPDLARARGHAKEAEALARGAIDELTEVGADEELAIARRRLGEALVDQGRFAEAHDVLELALASARAQKVRADDLAGYELALAAAELGLGKREDARARAERAKHVLEHYPAAKRARADAARLAR
jgi:tetratricopeptide (TPR) repeat protein